MYLDLTDEEFAGLRDILRKRHVKMSYRRIKHQWHKVTDAHEIFPVPYQRALLVQLLENYDTTKKKVVINLEELDNRSESGRPTASGPTRLPVTFVLGALAEDWPGMSNAILGIVHHKRRNVLFMKGLTFEYSDRTVGAVILAFRLKTMEEYGAFLEDKKNLIREIKDAAQGSEGKSILLDDEAVKAEIYDKINKKLKELYNSKDLMHLIEESGEVLKFVSARSRDYLEEREIKDLAQLILSNYIDQNAILGGECAEVIRIRNINTIKEKLTGISFICRESLFSIEDFLKTLNHIVPDHIIRHHKSYVTEDGILVYRIEIVDRNEKPLENRMIKSIETSMDKLITIACDRKFSTLKSVGGFEHYARAIIPFLTEEVKRTGLTQVFINVDRKTEFAINLKLIIVSVKSRRKRLYQLISRLSTLTGVDINSSIPPRIRGNKVEISILKLMVNLSEFSSIPEIFDALKGIIKKIYGDIRDFDQGFRDIYLQILNQLLDKLENIDAALIREIFFNIDEIYKIEISPNLLLELIKLCAESVEQAGSMPPEQVFYNHKHIPDSNRTVLVLSYASQKRLLGRLMQKLTDLTVYFTKIQWDQRFYLIAILCKNNQPVDDVFIKELMDTLLPS